MLVSIFPNNKNTIKTNLTNILFNKFIFKILILFFLSIVVSLAGFIQIDEDFKKRPEIPYNKKVKIAVLLPLTGKYSDKAESILNGIYLAFVDNQNEAVIIKVYDTLGLKERAIQVAQEAIQDGAEVILGPLLSDTTKEVIDVASKKNIPILSFSNDREIFQGNSNAYTFGYLVENDIEKIINYSKKNLKVKKVAVLVPENHYGFLSLSTIDAVLKANDLKLVRYITYPQNIGDLTPYIEKIIPEDELKNHKQIIKKLKNNEKVYDDNKNLISIVPNTKVDFDAVYIADFGKSAVLAAVHLPYLDIDIKKIFILGNSYWNSSIINSESILKGAYYPAWRDVKNTDFYVLYKNYYNNKEPNNLALSGYDAANMIFKMIKYYQGNDVIFDFSKEALTSYRSEGIISPFRVRKDGLVSRSMEVRKVQSGGSIEVEYLDKADFFQVKDYRVVKSNPFSLDLSIFNIIKKEIKQQNIQEVNNTNNNLQEANTQSQETENKEKLNFNADQNTTNVKENKDKDIEDYDENNQKNPESEEIKNDETNKTEATNKESE